MNNLRPMAASFVVKYGYHGGLYEFTERGPLKPGSGAIWECDHAHDTVDEAVACAERHEIEMRDAALKAG